MPARLERFQQSGDLHFLTFSCHARLPYLNDPLVCERFEHALETVRKRYVFFVFGYVIMPEHVHLLVSEPKRTSLAIAIQALKTSVAKQHEQKPFWIPRYYDFNVYSRAKHTEKLRYLHRNPVTRGLVYEPLDWRWSSFRQYATGEPGTVQIESPWTSGRRLGLNVLGEPTPG
jgi:putative transposase